MPALSAQDEQALRRGALPATGPAGAALGDGRETLAGRLTNGEYFGEIGLLQGTPRTATVRAAADSEVEVIAIDREAFGSLMAGSGLASDDIAGVMRKRLLELASLGDH